MALSDPNDAHRAPASVSGKDPRFCVDLVSSPSPANLLRNAGMTLLGIRTSKAKLSALEAARERSFKGTRPAGEIGPALAARPRSKPLKRSGRGAPSVWKAI